MTTITNTAARTTRTNQTGAIERAVQGGLLQGIQVGVFGVSHGQSPVGEETLGSPAPRGQPAARKCVLHPLQHRRAYHRRHGRPDLRRPCAGRDRTGGGQLQHRGRARGGLELDRDVDGFAERFAVVVVQAHRRDAGRGFHGERNPSAKLTEEQARAILAGALAHAASALGAAPAAAPHRSSRAS